MAPALSTLHATPLRTLAGSASGTFRVEREDIVFHTGADGRVHLEVTVHNPGPVPTPAATLRVRAAALGAFLRSRTVARLAVPPIPPFGQTLVSTVLQALAPETAPHLPADPLRRADPNRLSWAGNFDILVGDATAERHAAGHVRLAAGCQNIALFEVGSGKDAYRFEFDGEGRSWDPLLFCRRVATSFLAPGEWYPFARTQPVVLRVTPPEDVAAGRLAVLVTQQSTERQAQVEFGFGCEAIASRCFRR